jgi:hypothetical protein
MIFFTRRRARRSWAKSGALEQQKGFNKGILKYKRTLGKK